MGYMKWPTESPNLPTESPYPPNKSIELPTKSPNLPTKSPHLPNKGPELPTKSPYQPTESSYLPTKSPYQPNNYFDDLNGVQRIESSADFKVGHNLESNEHIIEVVGQKRRKGRPQTERVVSKKARRGRPPIEDIKERDLRKKLNAIKASQKYRKNKRVESDKDQKELSDLTAENNNLKERVEMGRILGPILISRLNQCQNQFNREERLRFANISKQFTQN